MDDTRLQSPLLQLHTLTAVRLSSATEDTEVQPAERNLAVVVLGAHLVADILALAQTLDSAQTVASAQAAGVQIDLAFGRKQVVAEEVLDSGLEAEGLRPRLDVPGQPPEVSEESANTTS